MDRSMDKTMEVIIKALADAGHDPYAQLIGYLQTGDATYITRRDGARELIQSVDRSVIRKYAESIKASK